MIWVVIKCWLVVFGFFVYLHFLLIGLVFCDNIYLIRVTAQPVHSSEQVTAVLHSNALPHGYAHLPQESRVTCELLSLKQYTPDCHSWQEIVYFKPKHHRLVVPFGDRGRQWCVWPGAGVWQSSADTVLAVHWPDSAPAWPISPPAGCQSAARCHTAQILHSAPSETNRNVTHIPCTIWKTSS